MKLNIEAQPNGALKAWISDVSGQEEVLVNAIRLCRRSAWACQSGECLNVESIAERVTDEGVELIFTPREGVQLNPFGLESCLRYMLPQLAKA